MSKHTIPTVPLCKDCAYYKKVAPDWDGDDWRKHRCRRPSGISLVTGEIVSTDLDCEDERAAALSPVYCGRQGSKFVPK